MNQGQLCAHYFLLCFQKIKNRKRDVNKHWPEKKNIECLFFVICYFVDSFVFVKNVCYQNISSLWNGYKTRK